MRWYAKTGKGTRMIKFFLNKFK